MELLVQSKTLSQKYTVFLISYGEFISYLFMLNDVRNSKYEHESFCLC